MIVAAFRNRRTPAFSGVYCSFMRATRRASLDRMQIRWRRRSNGLFDYADSCSDNRTTHGEKKKSDVFTLKRGWWAGRRLAWQASPGSVMQLADASLRDVQVRCLAVLSKLFPSGFAPGVFGRDTGPLTAALPPDRTGSHCVLLNRYAMKRRPDPDSRRLHEMISAVYWPD